MKQSTNVEAIKIPLNDFSMEVFDQTYSHKGESVAGMWGRVAGSLAASEKDRKKWELQFFNLLLDFKAILGGRILSNAGAGYESTTLLNCFADGVPGKDKDSMEGILRALRHQALILKSEGGYGMCADVLRPRGGYIAGIGSTTPGAVKMLEMWNTQSVVITEGSGMESDKGKKKNRKGAQMFTMSVHHPDIEEFITAKQTAGRLTKCNMSALITDQFMNAVQQDLDWILYYPSFETQKELYKEEWDGNWDHWEEVGGKYDTYKTLKARALYDLIMSATYNRNEPGVIFIDLINRMNNLTEIEFINTTNPCGEVPLPVGGACLLGSINCTQYVLPDLSDWDFVKLNRDVPTLVRMADNVIDITYLPLPEQIIEAKNKRRLGLGNLGVGSALMMMKVRYGSEKGCQLASEFENMYANLCYQASALLAKEKGAFPLWNYENFLKGGYHKILSKETMELIKLHGLRNSHLLAFAPNGNTGILANCVSGGCEPVFMPEYIRTSAVEVLPKGIPTYPLWPTIGREGDVNVHLWETENGTLYKWDKDRGYTKETLVEDYAVRVLKARGEWDPKADWAATTTTLTVTDHINMLKAIAPYVDQAISKTINLPNDYPYEDFKNMYMDAWESGVIKGLTSYREGTMTAVLKAVDTPDVPCTTNTKKRPKKVPCDINSIKVKGEDWIVLVGLDEGRPFEVFAFQPVDISLSKSITKGTLVKTEKGYDLVTDTITIRNIAKHFLSDEEQALTRMISVLGLKQGTDIAFIVEQLNKVPGNVTSFARAISRTLAKYIGATDTGELCPTCGKKLVREAGCTGCKNCGYSKCG